MIADLELLSEYLKWSDTTLISSLHELSEEEFEKRFEGISGSISGKAGHIIGVYELFILTIEGNYLRDSQPKKGWDKQHFSSYGKRN